MGRGMLRAFPTVSGLLLERIPGKSRPLGHRGHTAAEETRKTARGSGHTDLDRACHEPSPPRRHPTRSTPSSLARIMHEGHAPHTPTPPWLRQMCACGPPAFGGRPGCFLSTSADHVLHSATDPNGAAGCQIPIPNEPWLLGSRLHHQWWILDPTGSGSPLGLTTTAGLRARLGSIVRDPTQPAASPSVEST